MPPPHPPRPSPDLPCALLRPSSARKGREWMLRCHLLARLACWLSDAACHVCLGMLQLFRLGFRHRFPFEKVCRDLARRPRFFMLWSEPRRASQSVSSYLNNTFPPLDCCSCHHLDSTLPLDYCYCHHLDSTCLLCIEASLLTLAASFSAASASSLVTSASASARSSSETGPHATHVIWFFK